MLTYIRAISYTSRSTHRLRLNKVQKTAVAALEDIKARDITVLDTRTLTAIYDTLIIATAEARARPRPSRATCPTRSRPLAIT